MKFNPDLARDILLAIEATPPNREPDDVEIPGVSEDEILEYEQLLADAGLIDAKVTGSGMGGQRIYAVFVRGLTWEGHQFLAAARSDTLWSRAKDRIVSSGSAMTLSMLKIALTEAAKNALGMGGDTNM